MQIEELRAEHLAASVALMKHCRIRVAESRIPQSSIRAARRICLGNWAVTHKSIPLFMYDQIAPRLGNDYMPYMKHDLVRMRGPFIQLFAISRGRGGAVRVNPTLYVAGPDSGMEVIPQTLSLEVREPGAWRFVDRPLDDGFADLLISSIERESPVSFQAPLTDAGIDQALARFARWTDHWAPPLFRAFLQCLQGTSGAGRDMNEAEKRFRRAGRRWNGPPPDWWHATDQRLKDLRECLSASDGLSRCRSDAESHAERLRLPAIDWPSEWPWPT